MNMRTLLRTTRNGEDRTIDYVEALTRPDSIDIVERIYGSGHGRWCDFRPSITAGGLIYCDTCLSQISCIHHECGI